MFSRIWICSGFGVHRDRTGSDDPAEARSPEFGSWSWFMDEGIGSQRERGMLMLLKSHKTKGEGIENNGSTHAFGERGYL